MMMCEKSHPIGNTTIIQVTNSHLTAAGQMTPVSPTPATTKLMIQEVVDSAPQLLSSQPTKKENGISKTEKSQRSLRGGFRLSSIT